MKRFHITLFLLCGFSASYETICAISSMIVNRKKNEKHRTTKNKFLYLQICCRNSKRRRFPKIRKLVYFIIYARRVIFLSSFYLLSLVVFLAYIDVCFFNISKCFIIYAQRMLFLSFFYHLF